MKKVILALSWLFLLSLPGISTAQNSQVDAYIKQYKTIAIKEMVRTGVPAAISLAQGIIESGAGTTWLSVHANNQFGLKCKKDWLGETVHHDDDAKNECFRKYDSPEDSWRDHSNFLKISPRYRFLFQLKPLDFKAWAYGLKQAGYATSNRYARQLIKTIQRYHLNQYSKKGLALAQESKPDDQFSTLLNKKIAQSGKNNESSADSNEHASYPQGLLTINKKSAIFLPAGTQLIGVADRYDVPVRRLLKFNEIKSETLPHSMLVFIEKKRKRGSHIKHVVETGESYHDIAQEEGIRLKWLLKRNKLSGHTPPQPGDVLFLKGYVNRKGGTKRISGVTRFFRRIFGSKQPRIRKEKKTGHLPEEKTESQQKRSISSATQDANQPSTYTVKKGDTLYGISKKLHVSVEQLKKSNHLNGHLIKVGQTLTIPQSK